MSSAPLLATLSTASTASSTYSASTASSVYSVEDEKADYYRQSESPTSPSSPILKSKNSAKSALYIASLLVIWFSCSALCSLWSHKYLLESHSQASFMLVSICTFVQVASCALGQIFLRSAGSGNASKARTSISWRQGKGIGALHLTTTWFMNACMASSGLACANSIRGIEPLLAACLAWYWLPSRNLATQQAGMPAAKLVALFTIVIGVFASTWSSGTCQSPTFVAAGLAAAASNVVRNALIQGTSADPQQMLAAFSFSTFLALLSLPVSSAAESIWHGSSPDISSLLSSRLPAIGITSMIYNAASVYVCAAVSLVAHSLFTVLKRPISVGLAAAAGGLLLTQQMIFGNIISAIGLFLYSRKSRSPLSIKITYIAAAVGLFYALTSRSGDDSSMLHNSLGFLSQFSTRSAAPVRVGFYYPLRPAVTTNWTVAVDTSGGNVGNLVWFAGSRALIDERRTEYVELWDDPEPVDAAIFTTANMLWNQTQLETPTESAATNFWMQRLTKSIRAASSVPLVVTGLGSNGHFTPTTINPGEAYTDLNPHGLFDPRPDLERYSAPAKDLFQALQERKASVFARGTYTTDAAKFNGYSGAIAAGCPSLFLSPQVKLGQKLAKAYAQLPAKLSAGTMRFAVPLPPAYFPGLFKQAIDIIEQYPGSIIVMQDWRDVKHMNKAIQKLELPQSTLDLIKAQSRYYTSVEDWQESYTHVDAVFSWRIHGAMVGISIGLPVFVVAPDMRVAELCEAMSIPWSTVVDPAFSLPDFDAGAYLANVNFDGEAFDANRSRLASLYLDAFASAGIPPSKHLKAIGRSRK